MPQVTVKREIIKIDAEKCTGCGLCVPSCAEGALQIIDGKARLVAETYCDGLGACLGECPEGALSIEVREVPTFDEEAVKHHLGRHEAHHTHPDPPPHEHDQLPCGCPGSSVRVLEKTTRDEEKSVSLTSELAHWPVQLALVPPTAPFLQGSDLVIAADCVPFAYADFHRRFLRGHTLLIGCPKLDDAQSYVQKLAKIIGQNNLKGITVLHMEVPCCYGLKRILLEAAQLSGKKVAIKSVVIGAQGEILDEEILSHTA